MSSSYLQYLRQAVHVHVRLLQLVLCITCYLIAYSDTYGYMMIYDIQNAYQRSIQCISPTRKAWTLRSRWSLSYIQAEPLAIEAFFLELIIQNRSTVWDSDSIAPSYPSCQSYLTKKRTSKKFAELICDTTVTSETPAELGRPVLVRKLRSAWWFC
jgi:hypothetical protein